MNSSETPNYGDRAACIDNGTHLTETDSDGYCNYCGHQ